MTALTQDVPSSKGVNQDPIPGMDFAEELFVVGKERVRQSRRQKRLERRKHAVQAQEHPLDLTIEELQELQQADETLAEVRKAAKGGTSRAGIGFYYQDGVIYRSWVPRGRDEAGMAVEQLVLPKKCRPMVLQLAHDIPLASHMGKNKTAQRVLQRFYWPTLFKDVADHCKACPECQKTSTRKVRPAPMVSLPII